MIQNQEQRESKAKAIPIQTEEKELKSKSIFNTKIIFFVFFPNFIQR